MSNVAGDEIKVGDTLGAWKLTEKIGQGGMGAVFRAERADGHFEQQSAIKLLHGVPSVTALEYLAETGGDSEQGFAGAGLAIASHEGNVRIEQGVEQTLLAEIERTDGLAFGDFDGFRHREPDKAALAGVAGGHGLFFADLKQNVFVHGQA